MFVFLAQRVDFNAVASTHLKQIRLSCKALPITHDHSCFRRLIKREELITNLQSDFPQR